CARGGVMDGPADRDEVIGPGELDRDEWFRTALKLDFDVRRVEGMAGDVANRKLERAATVPAAFAQRHPGGIDHGFGYHLARDRDRQPAVRPPAPDNVEVTRNSPSARLPRGVVLQPVGDLFLVATRADE